MLNTADSLDARGRDGCTVSLVLLGLCTAYASFVVLAGARSAKAAEPAEAPRNAVLDETDKTKYAQAVIAARGIRVQNDLLKNAQAALSRLKDRRSELLNEIDKLDIKAGNVPARLDKTIRPEIRQKRAALAELGKTVTEAEKKVKHLESLERLGQTFRIVQICLDFKQGATGAARMREGLGELRKVKYDEVSYHGLNSGVTLRSERVQDKSVSNTSTKKERVIAAPQDGVPVHRSSSDRNSRTATEETLSLSGRVNPAYRDFITFIGREYSKAYDGMTEAYPAVMRTYALMIQRAAPGSLLYEVIHVAESARNDVASARE